MKEPETAVEMLRFCAVMGAALGIGIAAFIGAILGSMFIGGFIVVSIGNALT